MVGKIIISGYAPDEEEKREGCITTGFTVSMDCSMPKRERAEVLLALASSLTADAADIVLFLRLYAAKKADGVPGIGFQEVKVPLPKGGLRHE